MEHLRGWAMRDIRVCACVQVQSSISQEQIPYLAIE